MLRISQPPVAVKRSRGSLCKGAESRSEAQRRTFLLGIWCMWESLMVDPLPVVMVSYEIVLLLSLLTALALPLSGLILILNDGPS